MVTIATSDTTVGLPERKLTTQYVLQIASGDILLLLKEALVILTVRFRPLMTWEFVVIIIERHIL
jgi:hypothetical protein